MASDVARTNAVVDGLVAAQHVTPREESAAADGTDDRHPEKEAHCAKTRACTKR